MTTPLNLRSLDLNLLVFLDALLGECHVTRAANKIGVSQSAMSNALSRLRHMFKDDLLIRMPKGMEPTPRALELRQAVRDILNQTTRLMTSDAHFEAATSHREFVARMSDLAGSFVLPALMERLGRLSPGVRLDIVHMSLESTVDALEADRLDIAVSMGLTQAHTLCSQVMFTDRMICLLRKGHPLLEAPLTLDSFLSCGHIRVTMSPTDSRFVDSVLAEQGHRRKVHLNLPHWFLVPQILRQTDLVAVMSERAARHMASDDMVVRPLPFPTTTFPWALYWHRRHEHSRPHEWLREQVLAIACDM